MDKITILILEDDPDVQRLLAEAMRMDGFDTILCSTVADLHRLDHDGDIGLYLIDINLPDGDGLDVARQLRSKSDCGIVFITGRGDEIDTVLGLEFGADDYIVKPFRMRELRARIKSVVRRLRPAQAPEMPEDTAEPGDGYVVQDITIKPVSRSVYSRTGDPLNLTTLEFNLLLALTSPPNRALSRDQIMDKLRGPNWSAYDRTVDGLVSRLRNKLFRDGTGHDKIKTIRGIGYMFCDDGWKKSRS